MTTKELVSKLMEADVLFVKSKKEIITLPLFEFRVTRCPMLNETSIFVRAQSLDFGRNQPIRLGVSEYGKTWATTKGELNEKE